MDKYILKEGTIIEVEEGGGAGYFRKKFTDVNEYLTVLTKLTEDNLSKYSIQNSAGSVTGNYENKECLSSMITHIWDENGVLSGLDVKFMITDVDMVAKQLKEQAKTIADLQKTQEIQDNTISAVASAVAVGGTE